MNNLEHGHMGRCEFLSAGRGTRRLIIGIAAAVCVLLCCAIGGLSASSEDSDAAAGDTFNDRTFTYTVNEDGTTVAVTGLTDTSITSADIPSTATDSDTGTSYTVTAINGGTFYLNTALTSVNIPSSVLLIGDYAFFGCTSIESFIVSSENESYCSADGVLFDKDMTKPIQYPAKSASTTYEVPSSVRIINSGAFYYCTALTSVTLPDGLEEIGISAFFDCSAILSINIPDSVTTIGSSAFSGVGTFKNTSDGAALDVTAANLSGHTWKRDSASDPLLAYQTLSYDDNGSDSGSVSSQTVSYGGSLTVSDNGFIRAGYTFNGWNTQADGEGTDYAVGDTISNITSNITLYAKWTGVNQTVSFDGNGSDGGSSMDSITVTYGAGAVTLPANTFTKTGYTFSGWNTQTDGNGDAYDDGALISNLLSSITLYAQWIADTYVVTFEGNGSDGGSTLSVSVTYNAAAVALTANGFTRTGYTFTGWNTQANGGGETYADSASVSNLLSDLILFAQWTADTYTVTFDGNGADGGSTLSISVTYDAGAVTLTSNGFTRTGYSFTGWNTQANGEGTAFADGTSVSNLLSDLALYAQWSANTYTVTFDGNGSTSGATSATNVTYGADPVALTLNNFEKIGYSFVGWNTQADGEGTAYADGQEVSNLTSSFTLYAQWTANTYEVVFVGNGSTSGTTASMQVTYGEAAKALTLNGFSRIGYSFSGWNTQADGEGAVFVDGALVSDLTESIILYAQWTANTYTVTFDGNGSTSGTMDPVSVTYGAGAVTLTSNSFSKTGYTFSGWNTQADGEGTAYSDGDSVSDLTSAITLYAQWTIITYTISYDGNGADGGSTDAQNVEYGGTLAVSLNGFTRTGYSFAGWNTQADGEGTSYAAGDEIADMTSILTLYAQWTADTYAVTFDGNGSTSGSIPSVSVTYGAGEVTLPANGFTKTGYTFTGWNTQANGGGVSYADGSSVSDLLSDLTLYAQWTADTYTVSFDGNGSTSGTTASMQVTYGEAAKALTANGFTRDDYSFAGWNTAADGSGTSYADGAEISDLTADLVLYAQWEKDDGAGAGIALLALATAILIVLFVAGAVAAVHYNVIRP